MDDDRSTRLAALRVEYVAARREFERALDGQKETNARLHNMANRVQALYLAIYELEHDLPEEPK